jgi:hypothetical protein
MLTQAAPTQLSGTAMTGRRTLIVFTMVVAAVTVARSGHELPIYPSYYPHEIELSAVAPGPAAELLLAGKIQAYVGGTPRFADPPPATIDSIESLGSFVIVRINPSSPLIKQGRSACAIAQAVIRNLAEKGNDLIFHPYPVTPFHGDYLHHVDLAEDAKARVLARSFDLDDSELQGLKVSADSEFARSLVKREWLAPGSQSDVEVAEVGAAKLVASAGYSVNGWLGPAWIKAGWHHAALLLNDRTGDEERGRRIEADLKRLRTFDYDNPVQRINVERSLVGSLTGGCHANVAGYTVKREYFSTVFTAGIENVAYDSLAGLNSPMFVRTVKLKDFPWNGWLALGIDAQPEARWNPIAGFTDDFGRLMWSAVGDPAIIPSPNDSAWMLNRVTDVQSGARK